MAGRDEEAGDLVVAARRVAAERHDARRAET
jgi:hypothetical protein